MSRAKKVIGAIVLWIEETCGLLLGAKLVPVRVRSQYHKRYGRRH